MKTIYYLYLGLISFAIFLRATVSVHSYSGEEKSPMYGDFEAQRHWQEITVNLPISDWYENTTDNDLLYWGLDYPPLTAYHSLLCGKVAKKLNVSYVSLHKSRGITTQPHKNFMRNTVLFADILFYIPAIVFCCFIVYEKLWKIKNLPEQLFSCHLIVSLFYPGQIIIDNGHFQYNNISLGLTAIAIFAIFNDKHKIAAFFFTLSLNYKQMELYHALPFFFYLLAICFKNEKGGKNNSFGNKIVRLLGIGAVVIITFLIIWCPWLHSMKSFLQVVHRIFPLDRGVFEDKVSNVWCIFNVFIKIKENFTNEFMAMLCLSTTIASALPSSINLFLKPKKQTFLLALINSSLAFFLFSFQVHEKSILLAALPVLLYFPLDPIPCLWFLQMSTFSMFPLIDKDNLLISFISLSTIFLLSIKIMSELCFENKNNKICSFIDVFLLRYFLNLSSVNKSIKSKKDDEKKVKMTKVTSTRKEIKGNWFQKILICGFNISTLGCILLILGYYFITPPNNLPFLFPLLISAYSCVHFILFFLYFNYLQLIS